MPQDQLGMQELSNTITFRFRSDVTLIHQSYLDKNVMHFMSTHSGKKSEAHTLLHFTVVIDGQLPVTKYVEIKF